MAEKVVDVKINKKNLNIKCKEASGYDSHYYTIIYDNNDGRYLGEMQDVYLSDGNFKTKLKEFLRLNY